MNAKDHACKIPAKLRHLVLERDGYSCRTCGQMKSDTDPYDGKPVKLEVGLIVPFSHGGTITDSNLRTICRTCAIGFRQIPYTKRLSAQELIGLLERTAPSDLKEIFIKLSSRGPVHGSSLPSVTSPTPATRRGLGSVRNASRRNPGSISSEQ